mmetsp:Transcript_82940/g.234977  ORF Transcript_82940/g.234977 Transcript_82940/m.234977 type:complete len:294 (-) Transcript_82940:1009-1890(-)
MQRVWSRLRMQISEWTRMSSSTLAGTVSRTNVWSARIGAIRVGLARECPRPPTLRTGPWWMPTSGSRLLASRTAAARRSPTVRNACASTRGAHLSTRLEQHMGSPTLRRPGTGLTTRSSSWRPMLTLPSHHGSRTPTFQKPARTRASSRRPSPSSRVVAVQAPAAAASRARASRHGAPATRRDPTTWAAARAAAVSGPPTASARRASAGLRACPAASSARRPRPRPPAPSGPGPWRPRPRRGPRRLSPGSRRRSRAAPTALRGSSAPRAHCRARAEGRAPRRSQASGARWSPP